MARTPSASAHQKVLDATFELMAERGVDGTSMDAIAEASGVSKATVYKHWADKNALLLEMMAEANGLHARPRCDSGNTRADMVAVLS
jgi:AcrR family transcriptional regulator